MFDHGERPAATISFSSIVQGLLEIVAPSQCLGCDAKVDDDENADAFESSGRFCRGCVLSLEPPPEPVRVPRTSAAMFTYEGPMVHAIRRFKYGARPGYARPLGKLLARAALAYAGTVDVVVPIPLHAQKLRARGYNPAALIARPIARALGLPTSTALRRIRDTRAQASLGVDARAANVRGAFAATQALQNARVLLIDDVRTTGCTFAEAGRTALEAGAMSVCSLALAYRELHRAI